MTCCRGAGADSGQPGRLLSGLIARRPAYGRKGGSGDQKDRLIGRTKGAMNTKLHAVTDAEVRPIRFFMTAGQAGSFVAIPSSMTSAATTAAT